MFFKSRHRRNVSKKHKKPTTKKNQSIKPNEPCLEKKERMFEIFFFHGQREMKNYDLVNGRPDES